MAEFPELDAFLAALRAEGVPAGSVEVARLRHAFSLEPDLDRQRLKDLLACVLVKNPAQRSIFESLFDDWCPEESPLVSEEAKAPGPGPGSVVTRPPRPPVKRPMPGGPARLPPRPPQLATKKLALRKVLLYGATGLVAAIALIWVWHHFRDEAAPEHPVTTPTPIPEFTTRPQPSPEPLPFEPTTEFWTWVPTLETAPPLINTTWLLAVLGLGAWASGLGLWRRYRRRYRLPDQEGPPGEGPQWLPLLELESAGPKLLEDDEVRTLVWGIGRFVSEDRTQQIDLKKTVAATAREAGIPTVHFQRAVYPRQVWLWQDAMADDPAIERLAGELETSLGRAGLPVRRGRFADFPELMYWEEGQEFSPLVLEGHRQQALVAVLTDGSGLQTVAQDRYYRATLNNLLLGLAQWPRLAFVDFGRGRHGLTALLKPYGLNCIAPEDLPAFLGAEEVRPVQTRQRETRLLGELRAWAAAAALSPEPVDERTALELRRELGLTLSAWSFAELVRTGEDLDGRVSWLPERRTELLNWLARAEKRSSGKNATQKTLLGKALNFWRKRYAEEHETRRKRENPLLPWKTTPAERRLRMEEAFLSLWDQPKRAAESLYKLFGGGLESEIEKRLGGFAAEEWRGHGNPEAKSDTVFLPWRFRDLPDRVQWMLAKMGFARRFLLTPSELHESGSLSLVLGLCAGLGTLALGTAAWRLLVPQEPLLVPAKAVFANPAFQDQIIQKIVRTDTGGFAAFVGTAKGLIRQSVAAGAEVPLTWEWKPQQNLQKLGDSELWHAGTLPQPIRGCEENWPRRSLVVIGTDPTDIPAKKLAIQLLDRGSADRVLLGTVWQEHLDELVEMPVQFTGEDQLLVILPAGSAPESDLEFAGRYSVVTVEDMEALAHGVGFSGIKTLKEAWAEQVNVLATSRRATSLRGGSEEETDPGSGIHYVTVCGGTFTMGSEAGYDNEKPPHPVTLSTFEIGKYEVTNEEYARFGEESGGYKGDARAPAANVTWHQAREFCDRLDNEDYDYSLPSEAQWEYAARGGTTTPWSFGDNEEQLGEYAWFSGNSDYQAHPVGQKRPNPLGLYDMHGNVWEWMEDCYDENVYARRQGLAVNPVETGGSCTSRVLRGGSAWGFPVLLRSARRYGVGPESRYFDFGFRCVRAARRQHAVR